MEYIKYIKIIYINHIKYIFCFIRNKYIIFSIEELIRQNLLYYIIYIKKYKKKFIYIEKKIKNLFIDLLLIKKKKKYMLIECKSPKKKINILNIKQLILYKKYIKCKYYFLYNGFFFIKYKNNNFTVKNNVNF
ncbi:MAG: type I restriction enzyme HsdR N-terminal domain-containing protein [Candidatus Shikimatogenerans sp. AspAUS03]|uniref:Type I restriction enzyme HsdR N-terminal domain-containing protein n=1 Tax=Candidatus Shikimatogenerans sp. AspAUS03 TaxID=3158563 RepID=A0AAU7QSI1_9FLAO